MKKYRLFIQVFCGLIVLFLGYNLVVWHLWVEDLQTTRYAGGDLARLGYVHGSKLPRQFANDLPKRHLEFSDYQGEEVDVVTIGDSFSNPIALGENCYYQDHIATNNELTVLNIPANETKWYAPEITLIKLLNSGFFDEVSPRYVVLESVERSAVGRLGVELDFTARAAAEDFEKYKRPFLLNNKEVREGLDFDFVSMANFKFPYNSILMHFEGTELGGRVFHARLEKDLFSVENASTLLYLDDDIENLHRATPQAVQKVNDNLNRLARLLREKGTELYFLPAVDKFNLYREYLADDQLPRSRFFELLREMPKEYRFIDSKKILSEELQKGARDIYFPDDSHWSGKAVKAIFAEVAFGSTGQGDGLAMNESGREDPSGVNEEP